MKILVFSFIYLFVVHSASAGNGHVIGNGGSTLKCGRNGQINYLAYDLFEGAWVWSLNPVFSKKESYLEKAFDIVQRFLPLNPTRQNLYTSWITEFPTKIKFLPMGTHLEPIPDTSISIIPEDCELTQAVAQIKESAPKEVSYIIDHEIWNALDENNKAALVLHEIIYREALLPENSHDNSVAIRNFNQTLHAGQFKDMTLRNYINFIVEHEFYKTDVNNISIRLYYDQQKIIKSIPIKYYDSHSVMSASLAASNQFKVKDASIIYNCGFDEVPYQYNINFYPENRIKDLTLPKGCIGRYTDNKTPNKTLSFTHLEFSPVGDLTKLTNE